MSGIDRAKRDSLKFLGAAATLGVAGCCSPPSRPVGQMCAPSGRTPLAPIRVANAAPKPAFDTHTHLFNASDLHVEGALSKMIGHGFESPYRELLQAAVPILGAIADEFAIGAGDEMDELCRIAAGGAVDRESHRNELAQRLSRVLPGSTFEQRYDQAVQSQIRTFGLGAAPARPMNFRDPDRILDVFKDKGRRGSGGLGLMAKGRAMTSRPHPDGIVAFVFYYLLSPRHHNLLEFGEAYSSEANAYGLDACFAATVDFDHWLCCERTPSSIRDQILVHEQLAVLSGGYVLPLACYNPWTDILDKDASLRNVEWAVEQHGCVGVKIYPPLGFYPYGNADLPFPSGQKRPSGNALDEKLGAFYKRCIELDVPVMAHGSHSMGRDSYHDVLGGPVGWDRALAAFPGLRVNISHFGSDDEEPPLKPNGWTKAFIALMEKHPRAKLYGDLGFLPSLFVKDSRIGKDIAERLQNPVAGGTVADRIMYGTDWSMISALDDWPAYAREMSRYLARAGGDASLAKFYGVNAANCFGIAKDSGKNRGRLEAFYKRWNVATPAWMQALDKRG